jgi:hypothetical protein
MPLLFSQAAVPLTAAAAAAAAAAHAPHVPQALPSLLFNSNTVQQ